VILIDSERERERAKCMLVVFLLCPSVDQIMKIGATSVCVAFGSWNLGNIARS
jgi:hypothetical protein